MLVSIYGLTVGEEDRDFALTDVDVNLGDVRSSDVAWPLRHGSRPGAEYLDAGSITLTMVTPYGINSAPEADAAVGRFLSAWRRGLREAPGTMTPMLVATEEKARVVYGRPGRVSPPIPGSHGLDQGIAEIVAEFRILDPIVYAPEPTGVTLSVVPRSLGGIIAPIVTPVTTTMTSGVEYRRINVEGSAPAPLRVTFHGPAKDPAVTIDGVEVGIAGSLQYDEDITVDGRDRTVTFSDGRPASARLSRRSRLDRLVLDPGDHEISFTATDRTGTARVTVEATPAYYHI